MPSLLFLECCLDQIVLMTHRLSGRFHPLLETSSSSASPSSSRESTLSHYRSNSVGLPCIVSLTSFLFSLLQQLATKPEFQGLLTTSVVSRLLQSLQLLLPSSKEGIVEWIQTLFLCLAICDASAQITIISSIELILLLIPNISAHDAASITSQCFALLVDCFAHLFDSDVSVLLLFEKQHVCVQLARRLLRLPVWQSLAQDELLRLLRSTRPSELLAGCSVLGGELIGLFPGAPATFTPKKLPVNEKTGIAEIYRHAENCQVLQMDLAKETATIRIFRTGEEKDVSICSLDYRAPLPAELTLFSPTHVNQLLALFDAHCRPDRKFFSLARTQRVEEKRTSKTR